MKANPSYSNTDQGVQLTATAFTTTLEQANVLDGRWSRAAPLLGAPASTKVYADAGSVRWADPVHAVLQS